MEEHVQLAADSLMKLKKYPRVVEGNIRLAVYYMILNEKVKAKKHFKAFEEAKIPIHHFAFGIQKDYEGLGKELYLSIKNRSTFRLKNGPLIYQL